MFRALVVEEMGEGVAAGVRDLEVGDLPAGDVRIAVAYSSLNYKDAMVLRGIGRLVRSYPHVPGIDMAGTVLETSSPRWNVGDEVVLTGWRVGESRWGGYAQQARVSGEWLVSLPEGLSARQAMAVGTAGLAAMLSVGALEEHGLEPGDGAVLVTGAAGGVGSLSVALLSALGYEVVASTGRPETAAYLSQLGAARVIDRAELSRPVERPLEHQRWSGCIDNVGGVTLGRVLSELKHGGSVAAVGLAGGNELNASLLPFLLRGVNLLGIESNTAPLPRRQAAWERLARDLPLEHLERITTEHPLGHLPELAEQILAGRVRGRVVIDVNA
ncbi:MAG: oxidoreductase [Phycisphaerae bacterium]|nr:oxidoreductase [Phycisphaerae bacterium]